MKTKENIGLEDVKKVYSGPEGDLWELIMGEQIHIGGFTSSTDLAERAGIGTGMEGVDLCCCNGAGMRFLVRFAEVDFVTGVDATERVVEQGQKRCDAEGLSDKVRFVTRDVCDAGLDAESADFIWGEDAWCYVKDKEKLISEAARMVRPGGVIAFTDWLEGREGLSNEEARRYLGFMKFPSVMDLNTYRELLEKNGCEVLTAEYTGRFAPYMDLYLNMLGMQLTTDALRLIDFDLELMETLKNEMLFIRELAHSGKTDQGIFIAQKKG